MRPHLRIRRPADGRDARFPARLLAGRAVQVDRGQVPGPVHQDQGKGRGRAVDPGRRHVGRARHEPAVGRVDRAPARPRPAGVRALVRPALHRGVDPRRLRLPRLAPADLRPGGVRAVRDPEAVMEQAERHAEPHLLVAGDRRHPRAHPLPAGRHLQRRNGAEGDLVRERQLPRRALERLVPDAVRLWQRRWRPDARDGGTGEAVGRPRRLAARRARHGRAVLRGGGGRDRRGRICRAGTGVGGRALLRDAPRHVHQPDRHEARQPAGRAVAARGRALVGERRSRRRRDERRGGDRARRTLEGGAAPPVPRHPPGFVHRLGARGGGARAGTGGGAARRADRRRVGPNLRADRLDRQRPYTRRRRGRRRRDRRTRHRPPTDADRRHGMRTASPQQDSPSARSRHCRSATASSCSRGGCRTGSSTCHSTTSASSNRCTTSPTTALR